MAGVEINSLTPEQQQIETAGLQKKEADFVADLVKSVDLPASLADRLEEEHKNDFKQPEQEEEVTETETENSETENENEENTETDEELVPRSKLEKTREATQKRIDEQTATIRKLQRDLEELKNKQNVNRDPDLERLEKMSETELSNLKKQVRMEQFSAAKSDNNQRYSELAELEDKIDQTIRSAPSRFTQNQINKFNDAVLQSRETYGEEFSGMEKSVFETAASIYKNSPELMGSVTGQARAWQLAVDHHLAVKQASAGKSKIQELERKNNSLKRKVSVETPSGKSAPRQDDRAKLYKKALYGGDREKAAYLKTHINVDDLIPDRFNQ